MNKPKKKKVFIRTPNSNPVGVRNLNAKRKKYLFRSVFTKESDHHPMVAFFPHNPALKKH